MAYDSLGEFLTALDDAGEVVRVTAAVDPELELGAIVDRLVRRSSDGGPVIWFSNLRNAAWPVVANLLGNPRRLCRALGLESLAAGVSQYGPLLEDWSRPLSQRLPSERFAPRTIRQAGCQQVVKLGKDVNLWELPALRCWPGETHPALTAALVVTPGEAGRSVLSHTPLQVIDRQRLLPYWTAVDPELRQVQRARSENRQLPVALVFGGDPRVSLAAEITRALPEPLDYRQMGQWRQQSLDVVRCRSHELEVPADAEVIVEGFIDAAADWEAISQLALPTGHYSAETLVPPIQVTAITHRANPVFPVIVPGGFPSEDHWRREVIDRFQLPALQAACPDVVDCYRPTWGTGSTLFVSMKKRYPLAARTVCHALWGRCDLRFVKWIVVVDDDVPLRREAEVWAAVARHADPLRDLLTLDGPAHPDDHAAAVRGMSGKLAIDATRKTAEEGFPRKWPDALKYPEELQQKLAERWPELVPGQREKSG